MGLFNKKSDPISERTRALNDEIAALEAQIKKLSTGSETSASPSLFQHAPPSVTSPPRLRSTAIPHGPTVTPPAAGPVFEETDQRRLHNPSANGTRAPAPELGTRRFDFASSWERFKTHFRGPSTSNPKLVSYLAAGSIQGLRPLRYEKRVARNRFIVFAVFLALVLLGLYAIFFRNR